MGCHARVAAVLDARPSRHWLALALALLPFFSALRGVALAASRATFATARERTAARTSQAMALGVAQDALALAFLLSALAAVDWLVGPRRNPPPLVDAAKSEAASSVVESSRAALEEEDDDEPIVPPRVKRRVAIVARVALRVALHALLVALALVPFAVDNVLLRTRGMRFTFDLVNMYIRELDYAAGVEISSHEVRVSTQTSCATLAVVALAVALNMVWLDFSKWHPAMALARRWRARKATTTLAGDTQRPPSPSHHDAYGELSKEERACEADYVSLEDGDANRASTNDTASRPSPANDATDGYVLASDAAAISVQEAPPSATTEAPKRRWRRIQWKQIQWERAAIAVAVPVALLTVLSVVLLVVTHNISPVVSATAMNGSLNEFFRLVFGTEFIKSLGNGKIESAALYIHSDTESYELFEDDVLFRKTTGFKGPLAFDVAVNVSDPPNVLVLVVESFRYLDSLYVVGNKSLPLLAKQHNISLTPNFDRWAKRGVTMRNFWSSWQTSRSIESILFGQVPLDDITDTGTTTGRPKVELHGMPQLFKQKGYETTFTSGVRLKYDQWNEFLPTHGFDYVMGSTAFKAYGEKDYGVHPSDWKSVRNGGQGRAGFWGVHDDISFEVLGDLMINKTIEQGARVRLHDAKKPFFINHYTISSHTPFVEYPEWFEAEKLPDFSVLAEGHEAHAKQIAQYAKLRYFEDLALGKFLDRMQQTGVLNETVVVIVGDHGQSPEKGFERPDVDEITTTRVAAALIAENRLGESVGMVLDDAAEHYDLLNTLADIVGVPEGGFLQSGVGRSLKRAIPFGERPVWTNNPMRQLAVVKGHKRLSFDRRFNMIELYDAESDPNETSDLFPTLSVAEQNEWKALREQSRKLSRYFRVRWDHKCISKVKC